MNVKKLLSILLLFIGLLYPSTILAQGAPSIAYPAPTTTSYPNFLGEDQEYSVVFRGNGEAVVTLKVILSNLSNTNLSTIKLTVPNGTPQDITAYQVFATGTCEEYSTQKPNEPLAQTTCLKYSTPDYSSYLYANTYSTYQKADTSFSGNIIIVNLASPIAPNSIGSYFLYYKSYDFTNKDIFGVYNYSFQTLKVDDNIHNLTVGISTDSDLYMSGTNGNVNYNSSSFSNLALPQNSGVAISNPQIDNFFNSIGQGQITKTSTNLEAQESYTVKGSYADSVFKLYMNTIIITVFCIAVFIALIIFLIHLITDRYMKKADPSLSHPQLFNPYIKSLIYTFISTLLVVIYTIGILVLSYVVNMSSVSYYSQIQALIDIFVILISAGIYIFLFFAPTVYIGLKHGARMGITTFGMSILWMLIYLLIAIVVIVSIPKSSPTIVPLTIDSNIKGG